MAAAVNVLVYGKDHRLLDTRRMVLERSGYVARVASSLHEIRAVEPSEQMDLLIFCHTISMEECGRAIALCQARWPTAKSLFLSAGTIHRRTSLSSEVLNSMDGPEKLVATVERLVGLGEAAHRSVVGRVKGGVRNGAIRRDSKVV